MDKEISKYEESLDFVASHYDKDFFLPRNAWRKIFGNPIMLWRRKFVAAAIVCVVVTASAFIYNSMRLSEPAIEQQQTVAPETAPEKVYVESARIEFLDIPLSEAVSKIETTYGVKIGNLPPENMHVSLSYEGDAKELVTLLNETLGIDLRIVSDNKDQGI